MKYTNKQITIVSINGDDNSGGVERVVFYLNKILSEKYKVKILKRKFNLGAINKLFFPILFYFSLLFKKNNLIISNSSDSFLSNVDISIHHGTTTGFSQKAGIKLKKFALLSWMEKISAQKAKKIVAVSQNCKEELQYYYGIDQKKIIVLNNFVDESLFYPQFKKRSEKTIILFSGRLEERKGLSNLLEFAKELENSNEYQLKIACNSNKNIKMFSNLKNTQLFPGLDIIGMRNFYNSGDILYFPTKYEGFSMATLEALACGVPIIGTDFAIPKEIRHYDFVYLQTSTDPKILLPIMTNFKNKFAYKSDYIHNTIIKDFGYNQYKEKLFNIIEVL